MRARYKRGGGEQVRQWEITGLKPYMTKLCKKEPVLYTHFLAGGERGVGEELIYHWQPAPKCARSVFGPGIASQS